jgi:hypothetical protein
MAMKNSNDTIGNRTRDLPACSAVHHPNAPPRIRGAEVKSGKIRAVSSHHQWHFLYCLSTVLCDWKEAIGFFNIKPN